MQESAHPPNLKTGELAANEEQQIKTLKPIKTCGLESRADDFLKDALTSCGKTDVDRTNPLATYL